MIEQQLEGARQPVTEEPAWFLPGVQMLLLGIVVILVGIAVGVGASHLTGAASDGLVALTVLLVLCGGLMLAGLTPVSPGHARVIQLFGRYCGTIRDTGLKWVNPFTKRLVVSTRIRNQESAQLKVNDADGNPIYVLRKVKSVGGQPRRWLDIGCGTGRHVAHLHSLGLDAAGIDRSDAMIAVARRLNEGIPFYVGRAEDVTLPGEWDAVSMLFHVINYQVSDAMVHDALTAARRFLVPQGILAFDFWNSDGVLRDPPARRVREIETEGRSLYRLALPVAGHHRNGIDVRYEFRWDSPAWDRWSTKSPRDASLQRRRVDAASAECTTAGPEL